MAQERRGTLTSVDQYDTAEAAGLCDCGTALDTHEPLAPPKSWEHGRPCSKSALQRGYGWDGREAPEHTAGNKARWGVGIQVRRPARSEPPPAPSSVVLTKRQAQIELALERHVGNVAAAALELGITPQAVYQARVKIRIAHGLIAGPTRGMTERRAEILAAVHRHGGNRRAAARELGLGYATVTEALLTLRRLGIAVPRGARPGPRAVA